jgi:NUMOD3 motif
MSKLSVHTNKAYCVYLHRQGETVFYVGKGRPYRPFEASRRNRKWVDLVSTLDTYEVEIVLWTNDDTEARLEEARLIRLFRPACNAMMNGFINIAAKAASSQTHKGKVLSIETRHKIAQANQRRFVSPEERAKIGDALRGRPSPLKGTAITQETREKISLARKGKIPNGWQGRQHTESAKQLLRASKPGTAIQCIETGQVFSSINEAARTLGISKSNLRLHLKGRNRHAAGYTFEKTA